MNAPRSSPAAPTHSRCDWIRPSSPAIVRSTLQRGVSSMPISFSVARVPGQLVVDRRGVVHPIDDRDVLVVVQVLAELFEAAVQVADVRRAADDALAVELEHEAQRRVRRGVLRAEVERPAVLPHRPRRRHRDPGLGVEFGRGFGRACKASAATFRGRLVRRGIIAVEAFRTIFTKWKWHFTQGVD